jgi:RNA polymerase sigma factor (sigma-70 family)
MDLEACFTLIRTTIAPSADLNDAVKRVVAALICFAARFVGANADDVVQEWWIGRLPGLLVRYDGRVSFRVYAFDSLRRFCVECRRRCSRWSPGLGIDVADDRQNPLGKAWQSDLRGRIGRALWRLSKAERTSVVLVDIHGLSHKEAAQCQRCSVGALDARLCRGRQKLRELLKDLAEFL